MSEVAEKIQSEIVAVVFGSMNEEQMGVLTELEEIQAGDMIMVTTKLGRGVATGSVVSTDGSSLTVIDRASGVDQVMVFSRALYSFYKLKPPETDPVKESEADAMKDPLFGTALSVPGHVQKERSLVPEIQTIFQIRHHHAVGLIADMEHFGIERGAARHGFTLTDATRSVLMNLGFKSNPAREWASTLVVARVV